MRNRQIHGAPQQKKAEKTKQKYPKSILKKGNRYKKSTLGTVD